MSALGQKRTFWKCDVRFTPESGHSSPLSRRPLWAIRRHMQCSNEQLFDHTHSQGPSRPFCRQAQLRFANSELKEREVSSSLSFALLAGKLTLRLTLQPIIDVLAHHIPGQPIALLDDSFELLAPSVDRG